jgi:hypothetical protein
MSGRSIVRFSLDLEAEQKNFLKLFALKGGINSSVVMRAMIYVLETDPTFANRIIDLIFSVPEEEVAEDEYEDTSPGVTLEDAPVEKVSTLKIVDLKPGDHVYDSQGNRVIVE